MADVGTLERFLDGASNRLLIFSASTLCVAVLGYVLQWLGQLLLLRISQRFSMLAKLVHTTAAPMRFIAPLFLLQILWLAVPDSWSFIVPLRHIAGLLLIAAVTWFVIRCIDGTAAAIVGLRPLDVMDNLQARRIQTQTRVIARSLIFIAVLIGAALMLMTFPAVRTIGASLLASAGLAGIVAGIAARPVLSNLIAGLQIALSQPLRIDDVLIVQGEWGRVEEITGSYVVLALWDQRRLVVPLQWFIENPFQNWTRTTAQIVGSIFFWVDYAMPLSPLREELERICKAAPEWDGRVCLLQVTDSNERAVQLRALVSAADSSQCWDLRCRVREALLLFMQRRYANYLPKLRLDTEKFC